MTISMKENSGPHLTVLKVLLVVLFAGTLIFVWRFSPITDYLHPLVFKQLVERAGPMAPPLFVLSYALGVCLFLPALLFSSIGAMLFGTFWGYICNISGAMLGASGAFFISRLLGRRFAASQSISRFEKYNQKMGRNGFAVTLYLRLGFFPFTPMNFGMGLTKISFAHFFWGTFFGICAGSFALTFFFATLAEAWSSGQWALLFKPTSLTALTLFILSFFIPTVARKLPILSNLTGQR